MPKLIKLKQFYFFFNTKFKLIEKISDKFYHKINEFSN